MTPCLHHSIPGRKRVQESSPPTISSPLADPGEAATLSQGGSWEIALLAWTVNCLGP